MPCPKSRNKASSATGSQRSARTQNPKGAQSLLPDSSKKTLDCIIPDAKHAKKAGWERIANGRMSIPRGRDL